MVTKAASRAFFLFCLGYLFFPVSEAKAHAIILSATPASNAILQGSETDIHLIFNSRLDLKRSRLTLIDENSQERPIEILIGNEPQTINAHLTHLSPGKYRLRWQVLAVDGHITRGDIPFSVQ